MKKAKILVPAIAALVLSSAAAVTGTVAWFTSNLTAQTTQSGVQVMNVSEGNLTMTGIDVGYGCTVNEKAVTMLTLVDGSVDLATGDVYELNPDGGFKTVTSGAGPQSTAGATFRAIKYTVNFSYAFQNNANQKADLKLKCTFADKPQKTIAPAFRVGFVCGDIKVAYAPYAASQTSDLAYVNGTGVSSKGAYTSASSTLFVNEQVLGTFVKSSAETLKVDVYTWIEGEDAACKNGATLFSNAEASVTLDWTAAPKA